MNPFNRSSPRALNENSRNGWRSTLRLPLAPISKNFHGFPTPPSPLTAFFPLLRHFMKSHLFSFFRNPVYFFCPSPVCHVREDCWCLKNCNCLLVTWDLLSCAFPSSCPPNGFENFSVKFCYASQVLCECAAGLVAALVNDLSKLISHFTAWPAFSLETESLV